MSYEITYENLGKMKASGKAIINKINHKNLNRIFSQFYGSTLSFQVDEDAGEGIIFFGWYLAYFKIRKTEMHNTLKLVLTDHWFEEIKSGRKTHEYRKATPFWAKRMNGYWHHFGLISTGCWDELKQEKYFVQFQKAYRKNPERMTFEIKDIKLTSGTNTDLRIDDLVYDIELGQRLK